MCRSGHFVDIQHVVEHQLFLLEINSLLHLNIHMYTDE